MDAPDVTLKLPPLTGLRELVLHTLHLVEDEGGLPDGLAPLTALTALTVLVVRYDQSAMRCLAECVATLQQLARFEAGGSMIIPGWISGLLALPARAGVRYRFDCMGVWECCGEEEYEGVRQQLVARGAAMSAYSELPAMSVPVSF